jgi:phosphoribosyl 1,2-cyclic phosphate phosphodiesterase
VPTPLPNAAVITGELLFLGTGTSVGVPVIGCGCDVCQSDNPKNKRLRCGLALGLPQGTLLVDTTPDLRQQLLEHRIDLAHAVLYTHDHADHTMGFDDVRVFYFYLGRALPIYCEAAVEQRLREAYSYAFVPEAKNYAGGVPVVDFHRIGLEPLEILGQKIQPVRLMHGRFSVLGFRFGNVAYCTDTNHLPPETKEQLQGLDVLILDALRPRPHVTHFSLSEAIEVAQELGAKRTILTHMGHEIEHAAVSAELPPGFELAYDGLRVPLT